MQDPTLFDLARDYLASDGFRILRQEQDSLVADKLLFGQERDTRIVWVLPDARQGSTSESALRAKISSLRENYRNAKGYLLSRSRSGFSKEFQQMLNDEGIKWQVPIQFFDAPFNVEEAPKAASAIADLRSLEFLKRRIAQPFHTDTEEGPDLFDTLIKETGTQQSPTIKVVVGRAGIGKSFLFRAFFARVYEDFIKAKQARSPGGARPIPLVPEHLKGTLAVRTELLIDNFLRTDVAMPVGRETFEWFLVNGFTIWLMDGLDELYAGDPHFFVYLADLATRPNSKAQITIWCRDSLLTTSDDFEEFRELCGSGVLKMYRLKEWEKSSKRSLSWLGLEGRLPNSGEKDTASIASFLKSLDESQTLRTLSGLPFYCQQLLDLYRNGRLRDFTDDASFLHHVIEQMVQREIDKGLIDLQMFEEKGLEDWLEQMAVNYIEGRRYADIDREETIEFGRLVIREGIDAKTQNHLLTSLLQFPLFRAGAESGRIAFAHDLIAEALGARSYAKRLSRGASDVGRRLSKVDLEDPNLLRFIAARMGEQDEKAVINSLGHESLEGRAYAVLLSLILLARPERDFVKRSRLEFEGRDLSGVHFRDRDLSDHSFRQANLSGVLFQDCNLRNSAFEGAVFSRTRFDGDNDLQNARFGDLYRMQSILEGKKYYADDASIKKWISEKTGRLEPSGDPCHTALQIQYLFRKFISPLGVAKRDELKQNALSAGKKWQTSAPVDECIQELVRAEYLTGPDSRGRFRRVGGNKYSEIVLFVRDGRIGDGIGQLIARLCRKKNCLHQLY